MDRKPKERQEQGLQPSGPTSSALLPPTRPHCLKFPQLPKIVLSKWEPNIQTHKLVGNISHSNHNPSLTGFQLSVVNCSPKILDGNSRNPQAISLKLHAIFEQHNEILRHPTLSCPGCESPLCSMYPSVYAT